MKTPLVIVGEARGEQEARIGSSFVGPSGIELLRMLHEAGVIELRSAERALISDYYRRGDPLCIQAVWRNYEGSIFRTNVFNHHPPSNRLEFFCGGRAEGIHSYPALLPSKYVRREFEPELDRLAEELLSHDPNLILCLGNTALWALAGHTGVSKLRGTTQLSTHCVSGFKLLPTYHPAAILRQWENRPTTIIDLIKANREKEFADVRRPKCEIWIEPTLDDIRLFSRKHISRCDLLSVDIETSGSRITCIGFAPRPDLAIVIPFDDDRAKSRSYWPTLEDERDCWSIVRGILECPSPPKLFQNGVYDIAFLLRAYGIRVMNAKHDTMLLQHSLQPESLKGLGYLGSLYTDFGAWKVDHKNAQTIKRDA